MPWSNGDGIGETRVSRIIEMIRSLPGSAESTSDVGFVLVCVAGNCKSPLAFRPAFLRSAFAVRVPPCSALEIKSDIPSGAACLLVYAEAGEFVSNVFSA